MYRKLLQGVTIICLDCDEEKVQQLEELGYANLKIEKVNMETEGLRKVFQIILDDTNPYITFAEKNRKSSDDKLEKMVKYLEEVPLADTVLCYWEYIDGDGKHIAWMKKLWKEWIESKTSHLNGSAILQLSLANEENYFGNLECCMFRRERYINKKFLLDTISCNKQEEKLLLMFEALYGMRAAIIQEIMVYNKEEELNVVRAVKEYEAYQSLRDKILPSVYNQMNYKNVELPSVFLQMTEADYDRRKSVKPVKKEITFFVMGRSEYHNVEPLAIEAEKRGYKVKFTHELNSQAEIGIYCSHIGCIYNAGGVAAKFSLILLHDMTQGELDWPDLWNDEPWNEFDIGILPGADWAKRWRKCSGLYYTHPRLGVYALGYPKGDLIYKAEVLQRTQQLKEMLNLKYPNTILYAPSWENDGKEDEFVKAFCDLPVNLIIKHGNFDEHYPDILKNIREMRELHEGKYDNVYYVEPKENIMTVIPLCDILVSEESSVMTEALLYNKPSIAVTDWLIPDEKPHRKAAVPFDWVYKCERHQLRETATTLLERIKSGEQVSKTAEVFCNIGNTCSNIMDLIEYYTGERENCDALGCELSPAHQYHGIWD